MRSCGQHGPKSVYLLLVTLAFGTYGRHAAALASDHDQSTKAEFIPTGVYITPTAAKGSVFQPLNPNLSFDPAFTAGQAVTAAISPDGKTLLILTSGYNSQNYASGPNQGRSNPAESDEYVFVYNIAGSQPVQTQVVQIPKAYDGLAWNPNGQEFYVSGGSNDNVHVFVLTATGFAEDAKSPIPLGHSPLTQLGGILPAVAGIATTADGKRLVVANYEHDSVSIIDVASRTKTGELDLRPGNGVAGGEFPFGVAIQGNNTAYVTSERDREIDVVNISPLAPLSVTARIPLKGQPNRLILNKAQTLLFVAEHSTDEVAVISTKTNTVLEEIVTTAPHAILSSLGGYKGATPNSLALSPNEHTLYVTNGGANSLAVIRLANDSESNSWSFRERSAVIGLIPTGWYPNSVSVSADGFTLYVVNGKSNAGPNPQGCRDKGSLLIDNGTTSASEAGCASANQYIWQLTKAGFLTLPVPGDEDLERLTERVAANNHYGQGDRGNAESAELMHLLRKRIQHIIYVVKENRTYDQILGDLSKGNGDPSIAVYPQPVTPNQHALANLFVDLDNFFDSGETSGDGWNWSTSGRAADTVEKTEPVNYAGRGFTYDYEGTNRNVNVGLPTVAARQAANPLTPSDPNLLPGTADVSAPDGPQDGEEGAGYLWDLALRAGISVRNYGFFIDLTRYSSATGPYQIPLLRDPFSMGTQVAYSTKQALQDITDPYFRGFDTAFPDFYRVNEWLREFNEYEQNGDLPNLEFVRVMEDHTGSFGAAIDGVNTPEIQTADNDYAVGRIVEAVSHSALYKNNTLVFVIEDDAQDGPDHVDAHRSVAFVAGPYVKRGAVVSNKYTTVNMLATIEAILGIDHLGLNDAVANPMVNCFQSKALPWAFNSIVPAILKTTTLPLPSDAVNMKPADQKLLAIYSRPLHDAAWWANATKGFDFSAEDKVDAPRYNRLLWSGIMGEGVPYPATRSGRDLRLNREQLLDEYEKGLQTRKQQVVLHESASTSPGPRS